MAQRILTAAYFIERAAEELERRQPLSGQNLYGWLILMQALADQTGQERPVAGHPSEWATFQGWVSA